MKDYERPDMHVAPVEDQLENCFVGGPVLDNLFVGLDQVFRRMSDSLSSVSKEMSAYQLSPIYQEDELYKADMSLPEDTTKQEISVLPKRDGLEIKIERQRTRNEECDGVVCASFHNVSSTHYTALPADADLAGITYSIENGKLHIELPEKK